MIPMMAAMTAPPEGFFDPRGPVAPPPITSISVSADSVLWSYDAPDGFAGYIVKTTNVAGTSWESATLLGVTINEIVDRSTLPVGTVQVLVKPSIIYEGFLVVESVVSTRVNATRVDDGGPIDSGAFPGGPWTRVEAYASRSNKVFVGSATALQNAIRDANPGDCIVINANFSVATITVNCVGTAANKIIICSDKDGQDESQYRTLSGGNIKVDGGSHFIWRATTLDSVHFELTRGSNFQIESNRMVGFTGGSTTSVYTGGYAINCTNSGNTSNVLIGFNRYSGNTATWMHLDPAANNHKNYLVTHNHTENTRYGGSFAFGHNPGNAQINTGIRIQYHLDTGRSGTGDQLEIKFGAVTIDKCTFEMGTTSGGAPNQVKVRQQAVTDASVDILRGIGTNFTNLLFVCTAAQDEANITVRGRHNKVKQCWAVYLAAGERPGPGSRISTKGTITLFRAFSNGATFPESVPPGNEPTGKNRRTSAYKCTVGGNRMRVVTTAAEDPAPYLPSDNWVPTSGQSKNLGSELNSSNSIRTKTDGVIPGANYDAVPLRLFKTDTGPGAWERSFVLDDDDDDTGGTSPVTIGPDYNLNYVAFKGSSSSGGTPSFSVNMQLGNNEQPANAVGADIWASTTAADGTTYAAFGDGPNVANRVSFGIGKIAGLSWDNMSISYVIGGPSPSARAYVPKMAGFLADPDNINAIRAKAISLLARGDYLLVPMMDQGAGTQGWARTVLFRWDLRNMALDPTFGTAVWGSAQVWNKICPIFMQMGPDAGQGFDDYIYVYTMDHNPIESIAGDSPHHYPAKIYLQRALRTSHVLDKDPWQWFTGTPEAPSWGTAGAAPTSATAVYTFPHKIDWRGSAFYNKKLNKVIVRWGRGVGTTAPGTEGSQSRFVTLVGDRPWKLTLVDDTQITASGIDTDLAQLSIVPHTLAPDGLSWVDVTWGGGNADKAIFFRTTVSTSSTGSGGTLLQLADGVRLTGLDLDEPESGIRLFSRSAITKPFKIRYGFKRLVIPPETDANGSFNFVGILLPNSRAPSLNPALWPLETPTGDTEMASIATGWRITHGNINTAGTAESNKFRMRYLNGDGTRTAILAADTERVIDLGLNVLHEMELEWSGDTVILRDITSGKSQTFRDAKLGTMTRGYLMFYTSPLMSAEFTNVRQI